jgi:membrane protease YdiL (CAAX protease family)
VTKQEAGTSRRARRTKGKKAWFVLDPLFSCLLYAAIALGTLALRTSARLVILWTTLLVLWLVLQEGRSRRIVYVYRQIGRGALLGLAVGLPIMLLALRPLAAAVPILFVGREPVETVEVSSVTAFVTLALLAPLSEELFFRDVVQRKFGIWIGAGLYAASALLLFLPTAGTRYPVVLPSVVGAWSILGIVYAFCYERFGFAATLTCHILANLFLLFGPLLLHNLGVLAR